MSCREEISAPTENLAPSGSDDPSPEMVPGGRKYRLYPIDEQAALMAEFFGSSRSLHNTAVQQRKDAYKIAGKSVSYKEQAHDLKEVRDCPDTAPWLKKIPAQVLQQSLKDVDAAFQRFFKGKGEVGYPKFHGKGCNDSFRQPQDVKTRQISKKWGEVWLANLGWVRFRMHRKLGGTIKSATVKLKAGKYYLSFQVEMTERHNEDNGGEAVAIDMGVAHTVATSDGEFYDMPAHRTGEDERLRRLQKRLAKQVKGSRRHGKTKLQIAKIYARQARRRHDFAHKVSHTLATEHRLVGGEALKTVNMVKSASGTALNPGKNVAQKRGLNRVIHEQCWGLIFALLDYKCDWYGSLLVKCPAAYSSQECSRCGHIHKDNRKSQSVFKCVKCGYTANADTNAANIIKKRTLKLEKEAREAKRLQRIERKEERKKAKAKQAKMLETRWAKRRLEEALEERGSDRKLCSTAGGQSVAARGGHEVCGLRNENQGRGIYLSTDRSTESPVGEAASL